MITASQPASESHDQNGNVTATGGVTLDASGNTADDGRNSYWYDAEGRVCAVHTVSGTNVQYVYGPSGERIAQGTPSSAPSGATALCSAPAVSGSGFSNISINKRYLVDLGGGQVTELNGSGTWQHSNVFSGGRLTVSYDSKGIHYDLADPLGTKRVQANAQGQVDENCFSLPFGNDVNNPLTATCSAPANTLATNSDATEHHFTQKERDAESGNDYMFARYYSSALGRFLSPDWSAKVEPIPYAKLGDPQTLNLYAYLGNNPVLHVDLDGHCMGWCDLHGNQAYDPNNHPYQYQSDAEKDQKKQQAQQQNAASGSGSGGSPFSANLGNGYSVSGTFGKYDSTSCTYCIAGMGATINAYSNCSECVWVQVYDRTGADAAVGGLDNSALSGTPFYPYSAGKNGSFYDQPKNWMRGNWSKGGGTFSAVSVLGTADLANHTFHPVGAISWGYSVSAAGKLTISPPTSAPGRISEAMMFMHQAMSSWSEN